MRRDEKMIPKKVLLAALHEIHEAAQDPEKFAAAHNAGARTRDEACAFSIGWIEGSAAHTLGLPNKTLDLMQALKASLKSEPQR